MKKMAFTILKNDSTDEDGGFGIGVIDLNNITPIIIDCDKDEAYIDIDALHGRSQIEKRCAFHQIKLMPPKNIMRTGLFGWQWK